MIAPIIFFVFAGLTIGARILSYVLVKKTVYQFDHLFIELILWIIVLRLTWVAINMTVDYLKSRQEDEDES